MPTEERIALRNPASGRLGATIDRVKYDQVRATILTVLGRDGSLKDTQLAAGVERELRDGFGGSVRWYVTAVKLDLEARGELHRTTTGGRDYVTVAATPEVPEEQR